MSASNVKTEKDYIIKFVYMLPSKAIQTIIQNTTSKYDLGENAWSEEKNNDTKGRNSTQ